MKIEPGNIDAILYKYHNLVELEKSLSLLIPKMSEGYTEMTFVPLRGPQFSPVTGEHLQECGYVGLKNPNTIRFPTAVIDSIRTEDITLNKLRSMSREHERIASCAGLPHYIIKITTDQTMAVMSLPGRVMFDRISDATAKNIVGRGIGPRDFALCERYWFIVRDTP